VTLFEKDRAMQVAENVPYYPTAPDAYAASRCTVNVQRPEADGFPTFVYFHGGGLEGGDRSEGDDFTRRMLEEGFGVVSAHYRLHPQATHPAYLQDAAAAVAWTLEHIQEYGGNPTQVFVTGHSGGGYLAAMVGVAGQYLQATGHDTRELLGIVPSSGQMLTHFTIREERGLPKAQPTIDEFAPLHYAHTTTTPMLLVVGGDDMPARVEENALMHAVCRANGHANSHLLVVPGRDHTTVHHHWQDADDPVARRVIEFTRGLLD
jgi:acetyl esterase/lipase